MPDPDVPALKVGDRVCWETRGRRYEGTVTAVDMYGVETTQDAPPADVIWHHGPAAVVKLSPGTPPAVGHPEGVQLGGLAPAGPDDRPLPPGTIGDHR